MKLYPPQIAGTLPAFYADYTGAITIQVPFSMNAAVHRTEFDEFAIIIKTVQNNKVVYEGKTDRYDIDEGIAYFDIITEDNIDENYIYEEVALGAGDNWLPQTYYLKSGETYNLDQGVSYDDTQTYYLRKNKFFLMGQFYKVQLAYCDDGVIGYYSTVGVIKFTSYPSVSIPMLNRRKINLNQSSFIGLYSQGSFTYKVTSIDKDSYKKNTYYYFAGGRYILDSSLVYTANRTYYTRQLVLMPDNSQYMDATEKVHSYRFVIYDGAGAIVADSGEQVHNIENNTTSYESIDKWTFNINLDAEALYKIQYIVTTNNLLTASSPMYTLIQRETISPEQNLQLLATPDEEEGCMRITFNSDSEASKSQFIQGAFLLTRSCMEENYSTWEELTRFRLYGVHPDEWEWRDFTIEQGKTYKYALQQYNDRGVHSQHVATDPVTAEFEHAYLYDGERQLKIKYNPQISSFKTDILERKMETIGSQHPFIFRNGIVNYKEFSLSGLLSYQSDEANLFINDEELGLDTKSLRRSTTGNNERRWRVVRQEDGSTKVELESLKDAKQYYGTPESSEELDNREVMKKPRYRSNSTLEGYNITAERRFKLDALDWLNNGQVKLFRSPTEGNYLVRLMNVSLAPEDKLGRMIHTFSCTAYEVAECNHENLVKYGILSTDLPEFQQFRWKTVSLVDRVISEKQFVAADDGNDYFKQDYNREVQYKGNGSDKDKWVELLGKGEAAYEIKFEDIMPGAIVRLKNSSQKGYTTVAIGATGAFNYSSPNDLITSVQIPGDARYLGQLTYRYRTGVDNSFQNVAELEIISLPLIQFIGAHENIIDELTTVKQSVSAVRFIRFRRKVPKPQENIFGTLGKATSIDETAPSTMYDCWFQLENGELCKFNIANVEGYVQEDSGSYVNVGCGNGVTIEMCCELLNQTFEVELTDETLIKAAQELKLAEYEEALDMDEILSKVLKPSGGFVDDPNIEKAVNNALQEARKNYKTNYKNYERQVRVMLGGADK